MTTQTDTRQTVSLSVDTAVNNLIRMIQNQLNNVSSLVEKQVPIIDKSLTAEIDQYNNLVDQLTAESHRADSLELRNFELERQIDGLESKHADQLLNLSTEINRIKIHCSDYSDMKKELNRLKSMDPDALSRRVKEQRKLLEERLTAVNTAKRENRDYRKENATLKRLNTDLQAENIVYQERNHELEDRLGLSEIENVSKLLVGKDGLECYIQMFHWNQTFHPQNKYIRAVTDFPFHLEVRTNRGICLIASCSSWLVPFLADCDELSGHMPDELPAALKATYEQYAAHTHAHLLDRIDWARSEELTTSIGLNQKQVDLLADSHFFSVYAVAHIPDFQLVQMAKGIGPKGAEEIKQVVESHVMQWERQHWTQEQIKQERR